MKYCLYINGVLWEKFETIKEIDLFLYENNLDCNDNYYIEVKKLRGN